MRFVALDNDAVYEVLDEGKQYGGDELMEIGLIVDMWGDYTSKIWRLRKVI